MAAIPPAITTQLAHADPNASPLTVNELIDVFNPLFSSVIDGSYIPYIIQAGTPGADKAGYAWIETDSAGRPISIRTYYNGHWRRIYNGMVGEVRMYTGNPNDTAVWDSNGHGVIGGTYDGWQICNGKNSSPDLSDKFIVGGTMNNKDHSGYDTDKGRWQTFVDEETSQTDGGNKAFVLDHDNTYQFPFEGLNLTEWAADANAPTPGGGLLGKPAVRAPDRLDGQYTVIHRTEENTPNPVTHLPPFYCLAYITFQGYTT